MSTRTFQFDPTEAPNLNALWTGLAFEEWSRLGLSLAVVCPGSRSAPLAYAISQNPRIQSIVVHDERAAGFVALGAARATGRAAVVVTTSGTAVANLLPAAIEAAKTGTPMLLVTADRPPELHDCGANQCIEQRGIFGTFSRWSIEVPCADCSIHPRWVLSTADEAWKRAHSPSRLAGPVHLNWMFREPLAPRMEAWDRGVASELTNWMKGRAPWRCEVGGVFDELFDEGSDAGQRSWDHMAVELVGRIADATRGARRVVLCVGALYSPAMRSLASCLATRLGSPVIADIGSGLRFGGAGIDVVAHADLIPLSAAVAKTLMPDFIVRLGGAISSRRVGEFLEQARRSGARELVIRDGPERSDPQHTAQLELSIDLSERPRINTRTASQESLAFDVSYAKAWRDADARIASVLESHLDDATDALDEPSTARIAVATCPTGSILLVGNSMPIRDADMHAASSESSLMVAVNRGASGIDGLIATAVGHARVTGKPTVALVGDLSLLHDLGSLAIVGAGSHPVVIIVVNNDGGGIFHFLPLADHPKLLEPWTTAPHGVNFAAAAEMFGIAYLVPETRGELTGGIKDALRRAVESNHSTMIEVRTNRQENFDFHRRLQSSVAAELDRFVRESETRSAEILR